MRKKTAITAIILTLFITGTVLGATVVRRLHPVGYCQPKTWWDNYILYTGYGISNSPNSIPSDSDIEYSLCTIPNEDGFHPGILNKAYMTVWDCSPYWKTCAKICVSAAYSGLWTCGSELCTSTSGTGYLTIGPMYPPSGSFTASNFAQLDVNSQHYQYIKSFTYYRD